MKILTDNFNWKS